MKKTFLLAATVFGSILVHAQQKTPPPPPPPPAPLQMSQDTNPLPPSRSSVHALDATSDKHLLPPPPPPAPKAPPPPPKPPKKLSETI